MSEASICFSFVGLSHRTAARRVGRARDSSRLATWPSNVVKVFSQSFSRRVSTASALPRIGQWKVVFEILAAWRGMVSNVMNPSHRNLVQSLLNAASPPWRRSSRCSTTVWMKIAFIIARTRNNVVVLLGTLKVQSFMLSKVRDCDWLIVVTFSTFHKRKDMLKEKSS